MALVFPMFMISVVIIRSVILFKRGAIRDKEVNSHLRGCCLCLCTRHTDADTTPASVSGGYAWRRPSTR